MVAVAQFIPKDPEQKESVLAVLRDHPELPDIISRASTKAEEIFPDVRITLDTRRYDEWDPIVTMTVSVEEPWTNYWVHHHKFVHWLAYDSGNDHGLLLIMPQWTGPLESIE